ncbi:MAG TPA: DNA-processing protein DprA [Gammaproteobacteria bacterium]|nr:DNA-processing protein DprA [Gammaproteobacteria bacterium]
MSYFNRQGEGAQCRKKTLHYGIAPNTLICKNNSQKPHKDTHLISASTSPTQIPSPRPELHYWLALWRTPSIGSIRFFELLQVFPQLSALYNAKPAELSALGLKAPLIQAIHNPDWAGVKADLLWSQTPGNHLITWEDPHYPPLLKQITDPPPILFVTGNPQVLQTPQLAIVGSRNPTATGIDTARQFAIHLSQLGLTITSGLALGIDAASHLGALDNNKTTIAVLGCGLDEIYPTRHHQLARKIIEQGALVSEFPIGIGARAAHFPRRNRLVSGLSLGVLVVEATLRSGSLITARLASEQGREVFAIPGSVYNPLARGCHYLIRQGAKLVETVTDILEELPMLTPTTEEPSPSSLKPIEKNSLDAADLQLLECVGYEATSIEQLVARSGMPVQQIISKLLLLELQGYLVSMPEGYMKCP